MDANSTRLASIDGKTTHLPAVPASKADADAATSAANAAKSSADLANRTAPATPTNVTDARDHIEAAIAEATPDIDLTAVTVPLAALQETSDSILATFTANMQRFLFHAQAGARRLFVRR
jgi:FAD/FMN-containing dehydrogenase